MNFTVKKEGYPDFSGGLIARDDRPIRRLTYDFAPLSVSKPPVNPPQPSSTAILQNRTAELRNETAILQNRTEEYEQRLTWLEEMVQKIIGFLRSLGFKD